MKPTLFLDRRIEVRSAADDKVVLVPDDHTPPFKATASDISATGMRVKHSCLRLETGTLIRFEMRTRSGLARVVWTRILDGSAESGLLIVR